jgi:hypothetical protein
MVVPCQPGNSLSFDIQHSKRISPYLGVSSPNAMIGICR